MHAVAMLADVLGNLAIGSQCAGHHQRDVVLLEHV